MAGALSSSVNRLRSATRTALMRSRKVIGGGGEDKQLKLYQNMQPQDFNRLAEVYGAEGVVRYVLHMEAKRLKRNGE